MALYPGCMWAYAHMGHIYYGTVVESGLLDDYDAVCVFMDWWGGVRLTHYQTTNSRLFQLKEFADDNFKFEENGRKLSKWVENTVGKGEIARTEQFLLFPQCFQKGLFPRGVKRCHCVGMG